MAEENQDESQKTEEPTQRRLEEAIKRGQVINSKEVTNFFVILSILVSLSLFAPLLFRNTTLFLTHYIDNSYQLKLDQFSLGIIFSKIMQKIILIIALPVGISIIFIIIANFIQNGRFVASTENIGFKAERISLLKGFKRIFSTRSLVEFLKGILKIIIVSLIAYLSVKSELNILRQIHDFSFYAINMLIFKLIIRMLMGITIALAFVAAIDYLYNRFEYFKSLKMSKQELKQEHKDTEGSPEVKSKLRSLRMELAKRRINKTVPKADVLITNPTHFAIALKYDSNKMNAPMVIAKGQDNIALKMREIAKKHDIPIVENPPLAKTLYYNAKMDKEIPVEYYKAVAEIISYVFKLKNKSLK